MGHVTNAPITEGKLQVKFCLAGSVKTLAARSVRPRLFIGKIQGCVDFEGNHSPQEIDEMVAVFSGVATFLDILIHAKAR